jgi:LacI family transcriptional regulator
VLRGIREFASSQSDWLLRLERPGKRTSDFLDHWKPDGVLFQSAGLSRSTIARLSIQANAIHLSESPNQSIKRSVGLNNHEIGKVGAHYFMERGLTSFAFAGYQKSGFSKNRGESFQAALREKQFPSLLLDLSKNPSEPEIVDWLNQLPKPCGLLAVHDECALFLETLCRSANIKTPEEIAILGVDNDSLICELAWPQLSSIEVPSQRVGWEAAHWLHELLVDQPPHQTESRLLPPSGVETRRSTECFQTEDETVNRALRYIQSHFQNQINVEEILENIGVSRRLLERKFAHHLERSPLQELRRIRMEKAARLLLETNLPLHQLAPQCGCRNANQLVSLFKKTHEMTPGEYRKAKR